MQLKTFACLIALVVTHVGATAQGLSAGSVVTSIQKITNITSQMHDLLKNAKGAGVIKVAPKVTGNLKKTTYLAAQAAVMLQRAAHPKFPDNDQKDICKAFSELVHAQQGLIQTIISVDSTLSKSPFHATFAAILPDVEDNDNTLASDVISIVPVCAEDIKKDKSDLDTVLGKAIKIYQPPKRGPYADH